MEKKRIILVTDGDMAAKKAVEIAAINIGGRTISASAGNPTLLTGDEILELIKKAEHDPVIVMVDDRGYKGTGAGEQAMEIILNSDSVEVIGVLAVASNGKDCMKLNLSCSITKDGDVIEGVVDKYGNNVNKEETCGDTLGVLRDKKDLVIVGIGDPGKMDYNDELLKGSPITTKALQEILNRNS
ncbi:UNVERIFIED_CONTAM: stage V sporulation protein AE [Acetivibrio alkalicellulosi]